MAQPTPYTRSTNFNDYSTSNPSSPHQGSSLDAEFNALKTTTDTIRTNMALLQRDDGKLANLSVHAESLSNAVLTLIKATSNGYGVKGSWTADTAYAIGDLVESSQATYLCFEAHQSGLTFGANSSKFILLANAAIQTTSSAVDTLSGDASTVTFTLTNNSPSSVTDVLVFVNGSLRTPTTDYTIPNNNQITFTTAPSSGTNNVIIWGTSTVVEAAKAAAQAARDTAETHKDDANEHKQTANFWATKVDGTVIDADTSVDSNEYSSKSYATSESTPTTIYVTVAGGKFVLNGKTISSGSDVIYNVIKGTTYTFDVSDTTNTGHQLEFSISAEDATPDYTVTRSGTAGQANATVTFAVPSDAAATIYFYCSVSGHSGMGATLTSITESYAPSAGSAKEWASKTDGQIASDYSSKMYAQETSGDHLHGGSSKGWAQTAKNQQVPGAASTDRSAKHYSEVAADHKNDAETAKNDAESALDSFDDRYLGSKTVSTHPSADNDGNSLLTGALYWNTGSGSITQGMYVYNGSAWITLQTSVGGDTVTSSSGNNLNLVTPSNSNKVVINSGSASIQLPNVRASQDNYVLAMSNTSTGETAWQVTQTAPTITGITSGQLNSYYDADGTTVSNDKGGTLVIAGTDFGTNISDITTVRICASDGTSQVSATTLSNLSNTSITATWNGTESGYSSFSGTYYVEVVKSGLTSNRFNSTKSISGDPTISSVTGTGGEGDGITVTSSNLGSYGGAVAGGGQDSNTKLLLNFDRTGGTDIEDSSNTGGDGHKITASGNAVIKASPFGDGKSAMYFNGSSTFLQIPSSTDFYFNTSFTIEFWIYFNTLPTSGNTHLFLNSNDGATEYMSFMYNGTNGMRSYTSDGGWSFHQGGTDGWEAKKWRHVALVRDGNTSIKIFVDGKEVGKNASSPSGPPSNQYNIAIGGYLNSTQQSSYSGGWFDGYLDELRVVKGTAVYTGDFDVPTSRLTAITNTKLLIHSNDDFTAIAKTQNSDASSIGGWSIAGDSGGSGSSVAVNGDNLRHTTGSLGVQVWTTRQITGLDQNKKYSASCKIEACSETPAVSLYIGDGDNSTRSTTFSGITKNLGDDTSGNAVGKRLATDAWSPPASGTVYMTVLTNQNASNTCDINEWRIHNWDDASNSDHTITTTGSHHSSAHGGIAPAMTWPANKKLTGSAGVYFGGVSGASGDHINTDAVGSASLLNSSHSTGSVDCWVYLNQYTSTDNTLANSHGNPSIVKKGNTYFNFGIDHAGALTWYVHSSDNTGFASADGVITLNKWHHVLACWEASGYKTNLYVDGKCVAVNTAQNRHLSQLHSSANSGDQRIVYTGTQGFNGYLTNLRVTNVNVLSDSTDPLYSSTGFSSHSVGSTVYYTLPTKIYGAYFPTNPSVGTITITGATTDSTDIAFEEINNSLPNGLTLNDQGAGNQTATITGELTDVVTSDTTTSNIRIQAKANNDAKRITEINESSGVGAVSITKKAGGKPVLFNARRYVGNQLSREHSGYGFQPDFIWVKNRDNAISHMLVDSVRGLSGTGGGALLSNSNAAADGTKRITGMTSDGFQHYLSGNYTYTNTTDVAYIAWAWKAGGAPSSSALSLSGGVGAGTISSGINNLSNVTQSVNQNSGFSITKWTGGGATGYFPHNLGAKPDWLIIKCLDAADDWIVWHKDLDSGNSDAGDWIRLDTSDQKGYSGGTNGTTWDYFGGGISNTNIQVTNSSPVNAINKTYICYAWKAVAGVSAFGTYSGDGSNPVTVSNIGFKPRFLMVKSITGALSWHIVDSFRFGGDTGNQHLYADVDQAELNTASHATTFFSTSGGGFTLTGTSTHMNGANNTYIYMAFA